LAQIEIRLATTMPSLVKLDPSLLESPRRILPLAQRLWEIAWNPDLMPED
jgi:hypothetical protein